MLEYGRPMHTDQIDALYAGPPEDFVAERNELAKQLRADGKRAEADAVGKLRKPSVPAWAINRACRDHPKAARDLVKAAGRLASAQESGSGKRLREAMSESAAAVEAVMERVGETLADAGHDTAAYRDRARDTLRAVATDEALREQFEAGRVVADSEPVGFGPAGATLKAPARKPAAEKPAQKRRRKQASDRAERARKALEKADRELAEARRSLKEAEAERTRRADELDAAEDELGA
jgi:hypothetical protein